MGTKLISVAQAARYIEQKTGRPDMAPAAVSRWICKGIRGRRLEGSLVGGRWFTTAAAVDTLLEQLNADANHLPATNVAPRARRVKAAVAELKGMTATKAAS